MSTKSVVLLKADVCGSVKVLDVPLDSNGEALQFRSFEMCSFLQTTLISTVELSLRDEALMVCNKPCVMKGESKTPGRAFDWFLPSKMWNFTQWTSSEHEQEVCVHVFKIDLRFDEWWDDMSWSNCNLPPNKVAKSVMFSDDLCHGDMLLVCTAGKKGAEEIITPTQLLDLCIKHNTHKNQVTKYTEFLKEDWVPQLHFTTEFLKDFWDISFTQYQQTLLSFAMLTHARLGTNAIARNLDDNCMHLVVCFLFPFAIETEESWDVRKLLEVMKQACYNNQDEEASDYQDIVEFVLDDSDVGEEDEVEEDEVEDEEEDEVEDEVTRTSPASRCSTQRAGGR